MFNIVKLSPMSREFVSKLRPSPILNIAAAKAISNKLPLPSFEINDPTSHYAEVVRSQTNTMVSQLNEVVFINTKEVLELVEGFWKARYACANPSSQLLVVNKNVVHFFMGYGSSIAFDVFKTIESAGADAIITLRGLAVVVDELNKPEEQPQVATESFKKRKPSVAHEGIVDFVKGVFGSKSPTNTVEAIDSFIQAVEKSKPRTNLSFTAAGRVIGTHTGGASVIRHFKELAEYSNKHLDLHRQYIEHMLKTMSTYAKDIKTNNNIGNSVHDVMSLTDAYLNKVGRMKLLPNKELDDDIMTLSTSNQSHELCIFSATLNPKLRESGLFSSTSKIHMDLSESEQNNIKELLLTILSNEKEYEQNVEKLYSTKALENSDFAIINEFAKKNVGKELLEDLISDIGKRETYEIGGFGNLLKELTNFLIKPVY